MMPARKLTLILLGGSALIALAAGLWLQQPLLLALAGLVAVAAMPLLAARSRG